MKVGDRVQIGNVGLVDATRTQGTITEVLKRGWATIDWDDKKYPGENWLECQDFWVISEQ